LIEPGMEAKSASNGSGESLQEMPAQEQDLRLAAIRKAPPTKARTAINEVVDGSGVAVIEAPKLNPGPEPLPVSV